MSDTDGKKPLGLGGAPRSGQVKQSFSHGRTKSVVVEVKRKLTVVPNKGAAPTPGTGAAVATSPRLGDPSKRPAGISDAEMERRMSALRAAKAREADDATKRVEDEKAREEDRQRKREENGIKEREQREAETAARAPRPQRKSVFALKPSPLLKRLKRRAKPAPDRPARNPALRVHPRRARHHGPLLPHQLTMPFRVALPRPSPACRRAAPTASVKTANAPPAKPKAKKAAAQAS